MHHDKCQAMNQIPFIPYIADNPIPAIMPKRICQIFSLLIIRPSVQPTIFTFSANHIPKANSHRYCKKKLPHGL